MQYQIHTPTHATTSTIYTYVFLTYIYVCTVLYL